MDLGTYKVYSQIGEEKHCEENGSSLTNKKIEDLVTSSNL